MPPAGCVVRCPLLQFESHNQGWLGIVRAPQGSMMHTLPRAGVSPLAAQHYTEMDQQGGLLPTPSSVAADVHACCVPPASNSMLLPCTLGGTGLEAARCGPAATADMGEHPVDGVAAGNIVYDMDQYYQEEVQVGQQRSWAVLLHTEPALCRVAGCTSPN